MHYLVCGALFICFMQFVNFTYYSLFPFYLSCCLFVIRLKCITVDYFRYVINLLFVCSVLHMYIHIYTYIYICLLFVVLLRVTGYLYFFGAGFVVSILIMSWVQLPMTKHSKTSQVLVSSRTSHH